MPKFWTVQARLYRRRPSPMFAIRSLSEDAAKINMSGNALDKFGKNMCTMGAAM